MRRGERIEGESATSFDDFVQGVSERNRVSECWLRSVLETCSSTNCASGS